MHGGGEVFTFGFLACEPQQLIAEGGLLEGVCRRGFIDFETIALPLLGNCKLEYLVARGDATARAVRSCGVPRQKTAIRLPQTDNVKLPEV
jgi:hypothetical protein